MPEFLLGLDIGTTSTKGILLHPTEGIVAEAEENSTLLSPRAGWAEALPDEWWNNVKSVIRSCFATAKISSEDLAGIGVSGMVPTVILLDENRKLIRPSIQQNDSRAFKEITDLRSKTREDEILLNTGSAITQQSVGPKLLWLQNNEPGEFRRIRHVLGSYDHVVQKLTGSFSSERNWALESGLYNFASKSWDDDILGLCNIDREWLGEVHNPGDIVGKVSPSAANDLGLTAGTSVVAGSADHVASAFSAGVSETGDVLVKLGGAGDILCSFDKSVVDHRLYLDYHIIPGKYFLNGCMASSGSIIKWFKGLFDSVEYSDLDNEGSKIPPGSGGLILLPYFAGAKTPVNDPLARGTLFGLSLGHTRGHIFRSILEGISYGFMHHIEIMEQIGIRISKIRVTNGGAKSRLWKQITADAIGFPLEEIADHPGSSLGAAFIAGKGTGIFDDWGLIERFVKIKSVIMPDEDNHRLYRELFKIYKSIHASLEEQYSILSEAKTCLT